MAKYRFEYAGGRDVSTIAHLPNQRAAMQEAERAMNEVVGLRVNVARDFAIKIYDEKERLVAVVKTPT